jgi:hypothetical protein
MFDERISAVFNIVLNNFSELQSTYVTRAHVFHSLISALLHNRFGLPGVRDLIGIETTGKFFENRERAIMRIRQLAAAYEERDLSRFGEFVQAASEGGNRAPQRAIRIRWLCEALQGKFV